VATRGELILEMALEKCATFPGPDKDHPNPYFNLALSTMHHTRVEQMMVDAERNDEELGVTNLTFQDYQFLGPWWDGQWRQNHAPFLGR
jgi:hypothetical protein